MQARYPDCREFALVSARPVARKSLRPHLNQIRTWTRQGRTDAWVAHQLEVTVQQIATFKRESGLLDEEPGVVGAAAVDEEIDLRAEDDALIAAELEAAEQARREAEAAEAAEAERLAAEAALRGEDDDEAAAPPRRARRSTRARRGKASAAPLEGTFDHGEEGYGLWLDAAVTDDPIYAEHWAGHRPVTVTIEEDQIVIRRAE
jgi:hypothetical protein